jgi:hypothetical protein
MENTLQDRCFDTRASDWRERGRVWKIPSRTDASSSMHWTGESEGGEGKYPPGLMLRHPCIGLERAEKGRENSPGVDALVPRHQSKEALNHLY